MTKILELSGGDEDISRIREAARALRHGELVVFPTETVYGVGCDSSNSAAVTRLYAVKGRPRNKPLACYISSSKEVKRYQVKIGPTAEKLMANFWPGPLTILLPAQKSGGFIGFRFPDDSCALRLIEEAGVPMAATSANRSDEPPPLDGNDAVRCMNGAVSLILKGGKTRYGGESTIVAAAEPAPRLVRPGVISKKEIELALGMLMGE